MPYPIDNFAAQESIISSSEEPFPITPSDTEEFKVVKALYIGTGGNITVETPKSTAPVTFFNVPDAFILDVRAYAVRATGTTASDIVGLA